jgi:dolichol kinase
LATANNQIFRASVTYFTSQGLMLLVFLSSSKMFYIFIFFFQHGNVPFISQAQWLIAGEEQIT